MKQRKMYWAMAKMAIVACVIFSCEKEEPQINHSPPPLAMEEPDILKQIKLGKKLENPYSVVNMRRAYANLIKKLEKGQKGYDSQILKDSSEITTTDYYVKFWVENDEQKQLLLADSLNLSEIPLDVEIEQEGDYYVDEETEIQEAQWLYASVVKDYQFPDGISYEKVEDLFLIEPSNTEEVENEEDDSKTFSIAGKIGISKQFLFDLEDEALRLTGNFEESVGIEEDKSKKTPQGYVKVYNTVTKKMDPVVGVKVKTRRWFKWAKGWTNSSGYYKVNRGYRRDVHYTVVFKNAIGFKIWPWFSSISSARYRTGKHSRNGHNVNFSTSSVGWRWATVNNATVKYFNYCSQMGIGQPHNNLRVVALGGTGFSSAPMLRRIWGYAGFTSNSKVSTFISKANKITLYANVLWVLTKFILPDLIIRSGSSKGTDGVFSTAFHELAHASHFKKVGSGYWMKYINYILTYGAINNDKSPYGDGHGKNNGVCALGEAWANYFGYTLVFKEFGNSNEIISTSGFENFHPVERPDDRSIFRYRKPYIYEWGGWIPAGIMADIIDQEKDLIRHGYYDNVSGYTIKDIYGALDSGVESPQNFRDRLLYEHNNKDAIPLRQLFEAYYWN